MNVIAISPKMLFLAKVRAFGFVFLFISYVLFGFFNTNLLAVSNISIINNNQTNISNIQQKIQNQSQQKKQDKKNKAQQAHDIYVKYKYFPEAVYLKQRFWFEVEVLILNENHNFNDFNLSYINGTGIEIIDEQHTWTNKDNHTYTKILIAKVKKEKFKFPTIRLSAIYTNLSIDYVSIFDIDNTSNNLNISYNDIFVKNTFKQSISFDYFLGYEYTYNTINDTNLSHIYNNINISDYNNNTFNNIINNTTNISNVVLNNESDNNETIQDIKLMINLAPKDISFVKIGKNKENFSKIIARAIDVVEIKTAQYNNKNYKVTLSLIGNESNLEDFNIAQFDIFQKQVYLEINHTQQYLEYEILVPTSLNMINLNYYSIASNKFETIKLPIVLQQDLLSTQYGINPHVSSNLTYEKVLMFVGIFAFFALFYFTRHIIFVFFGVILIFLLTLSFLKLFLNEVELREGTTIFVLPTTNSYIYKKIQNITKVKVLLQKPRWSKILLENDKIGWIKNEDINLY